MTNSPKNPFDRPVRLLAPMEGLTDPLMRQILTQIATQLGTPYDWSVSEFIRVTHYPVPPHIFYKFVPELHTDGKTASGTPIHVQLLGNNSDMMAQSAHTAYTLGAKAIDLNFGCPAKTVNNHKGGSILLDEPKTLYRIISSVRHALPDSIPVSVKIRLGYNDDSRSDEIVNAVADANASWLTIHARTKAQGYKPPAHWHKIAPLTKINIPIIANGEIWNTQDANQCIHEANTPNLMLGRGAVSYPDLIARIACNNNNTQLSWADLVAYQVQFLQSSTDNPKGLLGRYKQWLGMLTKGYDNAQTIWTDIKKLKDKEAAIAILLKSRD